MSNQQTQQAAEQINEAAQAPSGENQIVVVHAAPKQSSFLARHKKKFAIGAGVLGAGALGYFGWKQFGGSAVVEEVGQGADAV
jgi:hypothetical protein